jgi:hypothetical protein
VRRQTRRGLPGFPEALQMLCKHILKARNGVFPAALAGLGLVTGRRPKRSAPDWLSAAQPKRLRGWHLGHIGASRPSHQPPPGLAARRGRERTS